MGVCDGLFGSSSLLIHTQKLLGEHSLWKGGFGCTQGWGWMKWKAYSGPLNTYSLTTPGHALLRWRHSGKAFLAQARCPASLVLPSLGSLASAQGP